MAKPICFAADAMSTISVARNGLHSAAQEAYDVLGEPQITGRCVMKRVLIIGLAAGLLAGSAAQSKSMKWMDAAGAGLPAGASMAVLSGNPAKAGPFKVQIKMPADYAVPAHHHPADEV